ncbi:MAG: DUF2764 family protein [Paludibacteraceae bacterium]|nr:DUF2764 family protein [Paludibacteraceae bacterium]
MLYHYLLAGLDELRIDETPRLAYDKLLELLQEQMPPADYACVEQLSKRADAPDILALMEDDAVLDRFHETTLSEEDFRTQLLYEQGMNSKNAFVKAWFEFNLNLNNVLAAVVCAKHDYDPGKAIVGDNEVARLLRQGALSKNANLTAVLPELKDIVAVSEIQDLLEREKHIDALRWQWIEDFTLFNYFELDNVLAYYLQATILHRWDDLTREQGEQIFRALLADMKKDIHLDN